MATRNFIFEPFDDNEETWNSYLERLEIAFVFNNISEENKTITLLHVVGKKTYGTLRDLLQPKLPTEFSYKELIKHLTKHFSPPPNEVAEAFKFHNRRQQEGEDIQHFATELKGLSRYCNFGNFLNTALRNQFIQGLRNEAIQAKLISESVSTMDKALELATTLEKAYQDAATLHRGGNISIGVDKVSNNIYPNKVCYRCGKSHTTPCPHINTLCNYCKKIGHIAKVCLSNPNALIKLPTKKFGTLSTPKNVKAVHQELNQTSNTACVHDPTRDVVDILCSSTGSNDKILLKVYLNDQPATMELDTGSGVSIMSYYNFKRMFPSHRPLQPSNVIFRDYNKHCFSPIGKTMVKVNYRGQINVLPLYIVEGDRDTLFGRDWLKQIKLNWQEINQLSNKDNLGLENLLKQYENDLFVKNIGKLVGLEAQLYLKPNAKPVFKKARSVPYALIPRVNEELDRLEGEGIISKVDYSSWATPVVPIVKANGNMRLCGDFKVTINPSLLVPEYPVPAIEQILSKIGNSITYSKIDVSEAFLHMPIRESDRYLLTINTHRGLYQYNRLPFGISAAPAIWQKAMEKVVEGIEGVQVFYDDIIVSGNTNEQHLSRLKQVFERFKQYNLRINRQKSSFMVNEIEYLGYKISCKGISKTQKLTEAIDHLARPSNIHEVRHVLGLINYYRRFIPNISEKLYPLINLTKSSTKFFWSEDCERAFQNIKEEMKSDRVLTHFDPDLPLILATDASQHGISAVLSHVYPDGSERPIAMASRTLNSSEMKYSVIMKEALAIYFAVKRFYFFLYGHHFTLFTDHKPLTYIFGDKKGIPILAATRLQNYAVFLQAFNFDIKYKSTDENANADALSRLPSKICQDVNQLDNIDVFEIQQLQTLPVSSKLIAEETQKDQELSEIYEALNKGKLINHSSEFRGTESEWSYQLGCLFKGQRVVIPKSLRKRILQELHEAHIGMVRMKALARSYVWWKNIDHDIEVLVRNCKSCQEHRNNPTKTPVHPWSTPEKPMERIHVDFAGPFMNSYYLIIVDAYSKWPEVIPMNSITTNKTIDCLRTFFSNFGIPHILVSDNGPQYTSQEFKNFLALNGIYHKRSAPYHPATNGQVERYVQTLKQSLRSMKDEPGSLNQKVARFLMAYRRTPHATTGLTPAHLFIGRPLRSRLDFLLNSSNTLTNDLHIQQSYKRKFKEGDSVSFRMYGTSQKWRFGRILQRLGSCHYNIESGNSTYRRHIDQIRSVGSNLSGEKGDTDHFINVKFPLGPKVQDQELQGANDQVINNNPEDEGQLNQPLAALPNVPASPALRRSSRQRKLVKRMNM